MMAKTTLPAWMTTLLVLALTALLGAGCVTGGTTDVASANVVDALSGTAAEGYARAYAPIDFTFPADHGPHPEFQTEWWYYTGNLTADDGDEFGYQLTFFRSALAPDEPARTSNYATNQIYMVHFAVTDGAAGRHESFERYSRGAGELAGATGDPAYSVWLEDWSATEVEPGVTRLVAADMSNDGPVSLDLLLRETRPPVLHGDQGLSQKGPEAGNASYYYSLVGLASEGRITLGARAAQVTGVSWMDHEFGTSALSANALGWDWFSVQLDNGAVVMFAQIRTEDGGRIGDFEGTLVDADGRQAEIGADDFELTVLDEWRSPATGIVYPSGWQVDLPNHGLTLTIEPLIPDQEMMVSFVYWEGAVTARGVMDNGPVNGRGYVELTGYGAGMGGYQR